MPIDIISAQKKRHPIEADQKVKQSTADNEVSEKKLL